MIKTLPMKRMENFGIKILRNPLKSPKNSRELLHHLRRDVRIGGIILKKRIVNKTQHLSQSTEYGKKENHKNATYDQGENGSRSQQCADCL
jgi:hypothetical protein